MTNNNNNNNNNNNDNNNNNNNSPELANSICTPQFAISLCT